MDDALRQNTVAIIDAGIGNTSSLSSAFQKSGVDAITVRDPDRLGSFRLFALPGVGNFEAFGRALRQTGLGSEIAALAGLRGNRLLGICVGAQILQSSSEESPSAEGLNLIDGRVRKISREESNCIPRVGWDFLDFAPSYGSAIEVVDEPSSQHRFFFSHSFCMNPTNELDVIATCGSAPTVPAVVQQGNLLAIQFHPERSGHFGQRFLSAFAQGSLSVS
jgi:imidazole glycerol phosphate synthase glutamine amidotransferase subunit